VVQRGQIPPGHGHFNYVKGHRRLEW
jgi:hypothetical protein